MLLPPGLFASGAPLLPSSGAQAHLNPCKAALLQMSPLLETLIPAFFFLKHGGACDLSAQTELGAVAEG